MCLTDDTTMLLRLESASVRCFWFRTAQVLAKYRFHTREQTGIAAGVSEVQRAVDGDCSERLPFDATECNRWPTGSLSFSGPNVLSNGTRPRLVNITQALNAFRLS